MKVSVQRDGLTLRGFYDTPANQPTFDGALILHGFSGNCGRDKKSIEYQTKQLLLNHGIAVARFDFNGQGESDGAFEDMTVLNELDDARKMLQFLRQQQGIRRIFIIGMSQGGVVASMIAGYYPDIVDKLVLMYPAATLKDDALAGRMQGLSYDPHHIPEKQTWMSHHGLVEIGDFYFRTAQSLPIYEVAKRYGGPVLLLHGNADQIVPAQASERYLPGYNKPEYHVIDGGDHGFHDKNSRKQALEYVTSFITS